MKRFLVNVTLFSVGLIGCFAAICSINTVTSTLNAPRVRSELLIAGDSHAQPALNPIYFASAQNIAQSAEPLYVSYWKLKQLLPRSSAETVLLSFSYLTLSPIREWTLSDERWSSMMSSRVYAIADIDSVQEIEVDRFVFYKTRFKNMCLLPRWRHDSYMGEGYFNFDRSVLTTVDEDIARHFFLDGESLPVSRVQAVFLDSIVALTRREQIELILVTTPIHRSYFERIPDQFITGFEEKKREMIRRGIQVLDYSKLNVSDEEFLNVTHLNEHGATRFSKLLSERIARSKD